MLIEVAKALGLRVGEPAIADPHQAPACKVAVDVEKFEIVDISGPSALLDGGDKLFLLRIKKQFPVDVNRRRMLVAEANQIANGRKGGSTLATNLTAAHSQS